MLKGILRKEKKLDSEILMPSDLVLKFLLQPRPMKLTVSQCRKGSGFLNGSWRQVRNHKILLVQVTVVSVAVRSFPWRKTNKTKLAKQCGCQASKLKTKSFEIFLKWRHLSPVFHYAVNFIGRGQSGKFKAWFCVGIHFFGFEIIFRCYRDTKT